MFLTFTAKTYDINEIDNQLAMFDREARGLSIACTKAIGVYGTVTVDKQPLSKGRYLKLPYSPLPMLVLPVGEVARAYNTAYTVRLTGFSDDTGHRIHDETFRFKTKPKAEANQSYAAQEEVALDAAREGIVLLKNDGVLPLRQNEVLNVFGAAQNAFRLSAWGAGKINPRRRPNFFDAVREHSGFVLNEELSLFYRGIADLTPDASLLARAREKSDTALIMLTRGSGENLDNRPIPGEYYLTGDEHRMIDAVCAAFEKVLLILNTGYPIEMRRILEKNIGTVLHTGFPGMLGAYALVELLDGRANPCAKLPDTWPLDYEDHPAAKNFVRFQAGEPIPLEKEMAAKIVYEEDIYVGYRYFEAFHRPVAYPFGHGLSYTSFSMQTQRCAYDGALRLDVRVKNTGVMPGKEVVQVYVLPPAEPGEAPHKRLAGFEKTRLLAPGEEETLSFSIERSTFARFDEDAAAWALSAGGYRVFVGGSCRDAAEVGRFTVEKREPLLQSFPVLKPVEEFHRLAADDAQAVGLSGLLPYEKLFAVRAARAGYEKAALPPHEGGRITFPMVQKEPALLDAFAAQMSDAELARLNVCGGTRSMPWQDGTIGRTIAIGKYKLPQLVVSDGNSGVNIRKPNIGFPASNTLCATFNKRLAYEVGAVIAKESLENGIRLNLGPAMNIHRSPLNGRHPEYFSEDPLLSGVMDGFQGKGLEENGVSCCYKHLCCNNSETVRKASQSVPSQKALREIYLKTFETAFRIHKPDSVMTAYNAVNGIYPAEDAALLQGVLRDEFGFTGFFMTDWNSYDTVDEVEMVKAGTSWLCPGGKDDRHVKPLVEALQAGRLKRGVLEDNIKRLLGVLLKRSMRA